MKIVLISCVSKKLSHKAKSKDLYTSPLFKFNLKYAKSLKPDKIFILSAKYGLVSLDQELEPYDKTLNKMNKKERVVWATRVLAQLKEKSNLEKDHFIFLAGSKYRENLLPKIKHYEIPLEGLSIGRQLKFLKEKIENE